jgi:hypothetical protein
VQDNYYLKHSALHFHYYDIVILEQYYQHLHAGDSTTFDKIVPGRKELMTHLCGGGGGGDGGGGDDDDDENTCQNSPQAPPPCLCY